MYISNLSYVVSELIAKAVKSFSESQFLKDRMLIFYSMWKITVIFIMTRVQIYTSVCFI